MHLTLIRRQSNTCYYLMCCWLHPKGLYLHASLVILKIGNIESSFSVCLSYLFDSATVVLFRCFKNKYK